MDTTKVFQKTVIDGKPAIAELNLPTIDAKSAVAYRPHEWAFKIDGFAAKAPPLPDAATVDTSNLVGPTGGDKSLVGAIGVVAVHKVDHKEARPA